MVEDIKANNLAMVYGLVIHHDKQVTIYLPQDPFE